MKLQRLNFKLKSKDGYELKAWRGQMGEISILFYHDKNGFRQEIDFHRREIKKFRDFLNKSLDFMEKVKSIK